MDWQMKIHIGYFYFSNIKKPSLVFINSSYDEMEMSSMICNAS